MHYCFSPGNSYYLQFVHILKLIKYYYIIITADSLTTTAGVHKWNSTGIPWKHHWAGVRAGKSNGKKTNFHISYPNCDET
jgi:hypothetical protein